MDIPEKMPTYNLKAVVQETGAKSHTLRAWEKRYGLPKPERSSSSGYRVYSQRDIEIVKWLMARLEEGLTIGRAADLWHSLEEKGEDPLEVVEHREERETSIDEMGGALADLRQQWIDSCLAFDKDGAERALTRAFALYPVKMVCLQVLREGLTVIGDLWYRRKATEQQEHFASALVLQRLDSLVAAAPAPNRPGRILVACPPHEEHTIALLFMTLFLRYRGWDVVYLGANVPTSHLEKSIDAIDPDLVIMNAQRLRTAASLAHIAQFLQQKRINVAYGGRAFNENPGLHDRIQGHFLGKTLDHAAENVGKIMVFNPPTHSAKPVSKKFVDAKALYRIKRIFIEADTWDMLEVNGVVAENLDATNARFYEAIIAALQLGDLDFVYKEIDIGRQLMVNYGISLEWQNHYFDIYFQAAKKHLQGDGAPIIEWLDKTRAKYNSK